MLLLIVLLSLSLILISSKSVDKEIEELDRLITLQKSKLEQLKQQKHTTTSSSSSSNKNTKKNSNRDVNSNTDIDYPLKVLDNIFIDKVRFYADYNIIDARILVTKLKPRRVNRKGKSSSLLNSNVLPILDHVQLFSLIDTNGTLHIINDDGIELDSMYLEHTAPISAVTYDGFDANSPLLITGDTLGNVHLTYLQIHRYGVLVAGNPKFIPLLPPASTAIDISVMSIINAKFKLPPLKPTNGQCDNTSKTCPKESAVSTYPTSVCAFYKAAVKYHVIYTGDSMGRLFQHKSNGDRLKTTIIANGSALNVCTRQGTTLALASGRSVFMVNAGKFTLSQRVCQTPSDIVEIDFDSKSANHMHVKLITGESMIVLPKSFHSRPANSTRCPILKRFTFENTHFNSLNALYNKTFANDPSPVLQYTNDMIIGSTAVSKQRVITTVGCNIMLFNVTNRRNENITSVTYNAPNCIEDIPKSLSSFYNKNKKISGFRNIRLDSTIMLPKPQGFLKLPPPNPPLLTMIAYNNDKKSKYKSTLMIYKTITRKGLSDVEDPLSSIRSYYPMLQHFLIFVLVAFIFFYRSSRLKTSKNDNKFNRSKFLKERGGRSKNIDEILKNIDNSTKSKFDDIGGKRLERLLAEVEKMSAEIDSAKKPQTIH